MNPLEWACRKCSAQPNEPCVLGIPGPMQIALDYYHAERIEDAGILDNTHTLPISKAELDAIIAAEGIV